MMNSDSSVDLLSSAEQQMMLAVQRLHPNAYGVTIASELEGRTGRSYSIGYIYATLHRLKERGFVTSQQGEPTAERGGRRKMFFTLTAPGQVALSRSLAALDSLRAGLAWEEGALA
jgi:PadR family transcriptional regulator, regulatory protein PadR